MSYLKCKQTVRQRLSPQSIPLLFAGCHLTQADAAALHCGDGRKQESGGGGGGGVGGGKAGEHRRHATKDG